jgi:hypothetical protein
MINNLKLGIQGEDPEFISNSYEIISDDMVSLKNKIAEIGYSTTFGDCIGSEIHAEDISNLHLFVTYSINEKDTSIYIFISNERDPIYIGFTEGNVINDIKLIMNVCNLWLSTARNVGLGQCRLKEI